MCGRVHVVKMLGSECWVAALKQCCQISKISFRIKY